MSRGLIHLKAFGTGGELALSDAFNHEFSSADHLICSIHMQRNVKQKLIDLCVPETICNEILKEYIYMWESVMELCMRVLLQVIHGIQ